MRKFLWVCSIISITQAGWIIKFEEKAKGEKPETTRVYISKGIIVCEKEEETFIFDFKKEILKVINHNEKSYFEGTIDEYIYFFEEMSLSIKEEIKEHLEKVPLEQRKMIEDMMKPKISIKKLNKKEKILGYNTEVYEVEIETGGMFPVKTKTENYISPDLKIVPSEISKEDAERISKKFEKIKDEYGFSNMIGKIGEGFILKTVSYDIEGKEIYKSEAISISKGETPASLIEVPKGYKKEELKNIFK